nr:hypothetical protein [Tanacetum cinerariifolium]
MSKKKEIIAINLDTSSENGSSNFDNIISDSSSTSQISTSEEIDYDSPQYKGPPKSLLKWCGYLSDEYKDNDRFWGSKSKGNDSDAKPCFSLISKAKEQASEASSKAKDAILSKTYGVKIPPTMTCAEDKKGKRKISRGS